MLLEERNRLWHLIADGIRGAKASGVSDEEIVRRLRSRHFAPAEVGRLGSGSRSGRDTDRGGPLSMRSAKGDARRGEVKPTKTDR